MAILMLNDEEIKDQILEGCRQKRLLLNFSQAELAKRAGLSTRTIRGFELGQTVNFMTLIKILRALGEFNRLNELVIKIPISPKEVFLSSEGIKKKRRSRATP